MWKIVVELNQGCQRMFSVIQVKELWNLEHLRIFISCELWLNLQVKSSKSTDVHKCISIDIPYLAGTLEQQTQHLQALLSSLSRTFSHEGSTPLQ